MIVPPIAAYLYGAAIVADEAVDAGHDPTPAILTAATLLERHEADHGPMPPGPGRVALLDAQAALVGAWARHDPTLIPDAERVEAARDLAIATMPRGDA